MKRCLRFPFCFPYWPMYLTKVKSLDFTLHLPFLKCMLPCKF